MKKLNYDEAMEKLGIKTQSEAAALLGVTLRTAHGYANGQNVPTVVQRFLQVMLETKYPVQKWL